MNKASIFAVLGIAANLSLSCLASAAGKYDGSSALICASSAVNECGLGERCQSRVPESVGLPSLIRIDFAGKKVHPLEPLKNRDSAIRSVYHVNERTVVSGGESGRGWVLNIHEQSGRMSA